MNPVWGLSVWGLYVSLCLFCLGILASSHSLCGIRLMSDSKLLAVGVYEWLSVSL